MNKIPVLFLSILLLACQKQDKDPIDGPICYPDLDNPSLTVSRILSKFKPVKERNLAEFEITKDQFDEIASYTADIIVKGSSSSADKIGAIVRWINGNIEYELADNSPYQVFKSRKAVCQGYANLASVMLLSQGLYPIRANGFYCSYGGHAWNYVWDGEYWYVLDPTNSSAVLRMDNLDAYQKNLIPWSLDVTLYCSEEYELSFYERQLTVSSVAVKTEKFIAPESEFNVKVTNVNIRLDLPFSLKSIELDKSYMGFSTCNPMFVQSLESVEILEENQHIQSYDGCVYDAAKTCLLFVPGAKKSIVFPPLPLAYKNLLFRNSSLTEVRFDSATLSYEDYVIEECANVRTVYIPKDAVISDNSFVGVAEDCRVIRF